MGAASGPSYPAFFSYAHVPGGHFDAAPNRYYHQFFKDVCANLYHLTDYADDVAFADTSLRVGDPFSDILFERLAQFRVFVPILSLRYFESKWCGYEWAAYEYRVKENPERSLNPIIPILWNAKSSLKLPDWLMEQRLIDDSTLPPRYGELGMFGLLNSEPDLYRSTVYALAERIAKAMQASHLEDGDPKILHTLPPRFGGGAP